MSSTVSALPVNLVGFRARTHPADQAVEVAAGRLDHRLAVAAASHARRAMRTADAVAVTGTALALAGGPAGVLALALGLAHAPVQPAAAARLLAGLGSGADPRAVSWLAAVLGPTTTRAVAAARPDLVGPLDGMPVEDRYAANRALAEAGAEAAEAAGDADLAALLRELAAPDRQLLLLDVGRGHVVEVLGDLRTADGVSVVVPGMGNRFADFDRVLDKARALRAAGAALDPPSDVATVAWLGYDSPWSDVVLDDAALDGGRSLVRTVDGLPAHHDATVTVVGHSYGSVVVGAALAAGLRVDAAALTGSPGVLARDVGALGDAPVYALRAPGDVVAWTEHFGPDPTGPDFGATRLATGDVVGHAGYFDPGSLALTGLALVAAGRGAQATVVRPGVGERAVDRADDVHELLVESPVDAAQAAMRQAVGDVGAVTDRVERCLPGGVAAAVDDAEHLAGAALETGTRAIDAVQRLSSPDLYGDLAGDAWDWATR